MVMSSKALFAGAFMSFIVVESAAAQVQHVDVQIENPAAEGVVLGATLSLPDGEGPFPAVVFISGSGPQDRDAHDPEFGEHRPFADWADYLSEQGVAVLRYDAIRKDGSDGGSYSRTRIRL